MKMNQIVFLSTEMFALTDLLLQKCKDAMCDNNNFWTYMIRKNLKIFSIMKVYQIKFQKREREG